MSDVVRTRFAPSPTGYLHIGGARTALFNYLLARKLGGKFVLRIEDTDQTRNIAGADRKLFEDLRWLGLQWDEGPEAAQPYGPYHQGQRLELYRAAAQQLLDSGRAYYAFDTREELDALRQAAQREKRDFRYPRPEHFPSAAEAERARTEGRPVVVRLAMPGHDFTVRDQILGDVTIKAEELDDFVIIKSDGWPTYHFAVVVDDEAMQITHVLRGQEHLMNTPNHLALQEALGYRTPVYGHLPIILNTDGSKMSKREKDRVVRAGLDTALQTGQLSEAAALDLSAAGVETFAAWRAGQTQLESDALHRLARALHLTLPEIQVHDFRASGYLPEVVVNFLALLGWNPGTPQEKFTLAELCTAFEVGRIGKTNARFDREKLLSFNTDAVNQAPPERLLSAFRDYLAVNPDSPFAGQSDEMLARLLVVNKGFRTFADIETKSGALFVADEQIQYDQSAVQKNLLKGDGAGLQVLRKLRVVLADVDNWNHARLEELLQEFGAGAQLGFGKIAQPLRIAVTGGTISPSIFDTLELLGRERTLRRIDRCLARVGEAHT